MADNLIPPLTPQNGDGDNRANSDPAHKTHENPHQSLPPASNDKSGKTRAFIWIAECVLAGLIGTGVWVFGEHLVSHGHTTLGSIVNFAAFAVFFAAAPITAIKIWSRPKLILGLFSGFVVLMALVFFVSSEKKPESKPHFTLSLRVGDSPRDTVVLTNDCLFISSAVNVITNFSDGFAFFNGIPEGMLLIPVEPGESNKVFNFIAKNDSPLAINDLEIIAGFSNDWKLVSTCKD